MGLVVRLGRRAKRLVTDTVRTSIEQASARAENGGVSSRASRISGK